VKENDSFEKRKVDHIRLSLDEKSQAQGSGLEDIELVHEALPSFNLSDVSIQCSFNKEISLSSPVFISSMTAGHPGSQKINEALASLSEKRHILMGVGSQRRQLEQESAVQEWENIRNKYPGALLMGNIGISELISTPTDRILNLMKSIQAIGFIVHLNPLQEALQPEGNPQFAGALQALEALKYKSSIPIIIKEVGCGMSEFTLKKLNQLGIDVIDVSGKGGTHWGRIEGFRNPINSVKSNAAITFADWGQSTLKSMMNAMNIDMKAELWASGGVRTGLDVVKLLAMGAKKVGIAQGFLKAYFETESFESLESYLDQVEFEMRIAMFCCGAQNLDQLTERRVWQWKRN